MTFGIREYQMSSISVQKLDDLISLYRAEFGMTLNREEAEQLGIFLVKLTGAVYAPKTHEKIFKRLTGGTI